MLVIHHPDQAKPDVDTVFRTGKFIPHFDRAERYRIFLDSVTADRHQVAEAPLDRAEAIVEVHDPAYVDFLKGLHARWARHPEFGPTAVPSVHPTHRMHRRPTDLVGELGWYSNSTTCPITADTWRSVFASAMAAVHGAGPVVVGVLVDAPADAGLLQRGLDGGGAEAGGDDRGERSKEGPDGGALGADDVDGGGLEHEDLRIADVGTNRALG